jgi:hypothetical protein
VLRLEAQLAARRSTALEAARDVQTTRIALNQTLHERQDRRYAQIAREVSEHHGKPILTCTELAVTDREYGNAGPQGVKEEGRLCYASAHRAIRALAAMARYAEYRAGR